MLLLLDVAMTDGGRLDVARALAAVARLPRTILLAERIPQEQLISALRLGIRGIVLREATTSVLYDSIRCVMRDEFALAPPQISDLVRALAGSAGPSAGGRNPFRLTRRELDVVSAVALGETNKEVARHFSIAEETVKPPPVEHLRQARRVLAPRARDLRAQPRAGRGRRHVAQALRRGPRTRAGSRRPRA